VAASGELPERPSGFDHVVLGLVLNFLPDSRTAVQEMQLRTVRGGGGAAYVWDACGMEFLRVFWDAAVALDDSARDLDEGSRFPLCRPDALESIFIDAGLRDVSSSTIEISTRFESFDDY
jgi:hypothetical protein